MTSWITVCDTCKREGWDEATAQGKTDGMALADLIEAKAVDTPLNVRRVSCLMGCDNSCNVTVQSDGKVNYTIGRFSANDEDAQGIVDYALSHAESETGVVPYRTWPQAVKGHFITRHHPLPNSNLGEK